MIKIVFILADGARREVDANIGQTLREVALLYSIPGLPGECGGVCACATCHVVVSPDWFAVVGPPSDFEDDLLLVTEHRETYSRLGCQVEVTREMNGLEVRIPPTS